MNEISLIGPANNYILQTFQSMTIIPVHYSKIYRAGEGALRNHKATVWPTKKATGLGLFLAMHGLLND